MHKRTRAALVGLLGADVAAIVADYEDGTSLTTDALKVALGLELRLCVFNMAHDLSDWSLAEMVARGTQDLRCLRMRDDYEIWLHRACSRVRHVTNRPLFLGASRLVRAHMAVAYANDYMQYECVCGTLSHRLGYLLSPMHTSRDYHIAMIRENIARTSDMARVLFS